MTKRIWSLDVLRGVAIAIMLFLDAPPDNIYPILMHAPWEGLTVPDIALPMFAFAMGAGATKNATLETGYVVRVPLFINEGDVLRIDTRTGNYIERA